MITTPSFDSAIAMADKVYDAGDKIKALHILITAHSADKKLSVADEMNYYTWCAETYRKDLNDIEQYLAYADTIIETLEKNELVKDMANRYIQALNMKADAFFQKALYNESYDYYYKAKKLAEDNSDSCSLSQFSYSLGMVLYRQQRYLDAAGYFKEANSEINRCKDMFIFFYRRQELLDNIGLCYYHAEKYDSAMAYYKKAVAYIDANNLRFGKNKNVFISARAVVYGNMADLYTIIKKYDTAKILLKRSTAINIQKGYANEDALTDQLKLASLYLTTGDMAEMKLLLTGIKAELDTITDNKHATLAWTKLMWQYADKTNDKATAYTFISAYERLNDSFAATNKALMTSDVDGRIKSLEKQFQIQLLNKNNYQSKVYLVVAGVIVLMALVILLLILNTVKKSRENIRNLSRLNNTVNEQKEKLQIALSELEWKDKDKSRILRSAAHDVLNPLAAISGMTQILISESEHFQDEHKEILSLMKEACDNSIGLSKEILEAANLADQKNLAKENTDLNKLIHSSLDLFNLRAASKNQQLIFYARQEQVEAFVNKEKIWRVINNLISNAIKFSYENSVIDIRLEIISGKIDISVKDTGIGIPEKNKPFIFDMFSEAKTQGTRGEAPHGLGLSISLQIAKAHYGTIWVESEEGKGSTFHLILPVNNNKA
jgi:signal transduction histidine kinase